MKAENIKSLLLDYAQEQGDFKKGCIEDLTHDQIIEFKINI